MPEKGTVLKTYPISPRIGLAWDLLGDHNTVVRLHYGRYHDALLGGTYYHMDTSQQHPNRHSARERTERLYDHRHGGRREQRRHGSQYQAVVPWIRYLAGIERELLTDMSVQVQV